MDIVYYPIIAGFIFCGIVLGIMAWIIYESNKSFS